MIHVLFELQLVFATVVVNFRMAQRPLLSPSQSHHEGGDWFTNAGAMGGLLRTRDKLKAFSPEKKARVRRGLDGSSRSAERNAMSLDTSFVYLYTNRLGET